MPWPPNLAAKILSGYIAQKYDMDAITIRRFDPPMGAMPFFNNSATAAIRTAELTLVAGQMLKFLHDLEIAFEQGADGDKAIEDLVTAMNDEAALSSGMVEAIDGCYRFRDEA